VINTVIAVRCFVGRLFGNFDLITFLSGHSIFIVCPAAEIDQFASLGTERPPGIVLPFSGLSARGTFRHKAKVRRKGGKVKAGDIRDGNYSVQFYQARMRGLNARGSRCFSFDEL
jgi:hypothetical protein